MEKKPRERKTKLNSFDKKKMDDLSRLIVLYEELTGCRVDAIQYGKAKYGKASTASTLRNYVEFLLKSYPSVDNDDNDYLKYTHRLPHRIDITVGYNNNEILGFGLGMPEEVYWAKNFSWSRIEKEFGILVRKTKRDIALMKKGSLG